MGHPATPPKAELAGGTTTGNVLARERKKKCPKCSGLGTVPYETDAGDVERTVCPLCRGNKQITEIR